MLKDVKACSGEKGAAWAEGHEASVTFGVHF